MRDIPSGRKAKNTILFIGDGMTTNMITGSVISPYRRLNIANCTAAARLIGHKSINGKYQSKMQMDQFPVVGVSGHCAWQRMLTKSLLTSTTAASNDAQP